MIKSMGVRVSPDEVVDVLLSSGDVTEALVSSEPDDARGELIVAYVVLARGGSVERLERYCRNEMPSYMQPCRYEVRGALRRTSSGKHDIAATVAGRPS
jgi:acyl-coenzyme A synthetase/AMP-(fatty) acid ligase